MTTKVYSDGDLTHILFAYAKKVENSSLFYYLRDTGPEFFLQTDSTKPGDTVEKLKVALEAIAPRLEPIKFTLSGISVSSFDEVVKEGEERGDNWPKKEWFECFDDEADTDTAVILTYSLLPDQVKALKAHSNRVVLVPYGHLFMNSAINFYPHKSTIIHTK